MSSRERNFWKGTLILIFLAFIMSYSPSVGAVPLFGGGGANANWAVLPPYNTLWPLWSPALSPIDPITGLPTPIVSNLAPSTTLPVQPGLTWDPAIPYPWLLYNTPIGMAYYDPLFGIDLWPPSYLTLGPLVLPPNYANLPAISSLWISTAVPIANALYLKSLPKFSLPALMLTPTVPLAPPVVSPVPPTPIVPPVVPVTPIAPVPPATPALPLTGITLLTPTAII